MIQQKVQGNDHWSFLYTYVTFNQMVYYSVAFGPDGRVNEIRPVDTHFPDGGEKGD